MVEAWFLLTMADVLAWGFGQVVAKRATVALGPGGMVLMVAVIDGTTFGTWWAALQRPPFSSPRATVFGLAAGISGMLGYILYYEALEHGKVSPVGFITGAAPLVTIGGALVFLQETFAPSVAVGIALLVACVLLYSYEPVMGGNRLAGRATAYALVTLVLWGAWGLFAKVALEDGTGGESDVFMFYTLSNFLLGVPYFLWRRRRPTKGRWMARGQLVLYGLNTLLLALGILALTLALGQGQAALVSAVSGTYPVVTVVVAAVFLKERVRWFQTAATGVFIAGIILVAF